MTDNAETRTRVEGECQPPAVFSDPGSKGADPNMPPEGYSHVDPVPDREALIEIKRIAETDVDGTGIHKIGLIAFNALTAQPRSNRVEQK